MGWCAWLLVSWVLNLDVVSAQWLTEPAIEPAVRGLMQSIMIGLGLLWPVCRLSIAVDDPPGIATAVDLATLLIIVQPVLWLVRLQAGWTLDRTLLIDVTLTVWAAAAGLFIWAGRMSASNAGRSGAMAACVGLMIGGWFVTLLTGIAEPASWSPPHMLWALTREISVDEARAEAGRLVVLSAGVAIAWLVMLIRYRPAAQTGV